MNQLTLRIIQQYNGKYFPFSQNDYIVKNKWGHADPTKRRGAWTGNSYDNKGNVTSYGFEGGCCYGLAAAYLVYGSCWDKFIHTINSPRGQGLVRGVMNLQEQLSKLSQMSQNIEVFKTILSANAVKFKNEYPSMFSSTPEKMASNLISILKNNNNYHLNIKGSTSAHSLSLRLENNTFKLFDPNYGYFQFQWIEGQNQAIETFLTHYFNEYYKSYFTLVAQQFS
ncbi:YopT-type cysteine protease domain-containing protein [Buttiauxella sp.]|uniref:YopT-type cysteine protease domain-containing protein n=1 Tax=Buttiauxella sp. TaxID=1972222 RepID=UPI003C768999